MNQKDRRELEEIISLAIERAALPDGRFNYYKATETVLYNYPELCAIVGSFEDYAEDLQKQKSKSITSGAANGYYRDQEDIQDERAAARFTSFERTRNELFVIDTILDRFRDREAFKVIEMYYFAGEGQMTFGDIAEVLGKSEKTVRSWRTKLVKDIGVLLFGVKAAPSICGLATPKKH